MEDTYNLNYLVVEFHKQYKMCNNAFMNRNSLNCHWLNVSVLNQHNLWGVVCSTWVWPSHPLNRTCWTPGPPWAEIASECQSTLSSWEDPHPDPWLLYYCLSGTAPVLCVWWISRVKWCPASSGGCESVRRSKEKRLFGRHKINQVTKQSCKKD